MLINLYSNILSSNVRIIQNEGDRMRIKKLDSNEFKGYSLTVEYETSHYYDVIYDNLGLRLELKSFDTPVKKGFTDELYAEWLEDPIAFGIYDNDQMIGVIEGSIESWHDLFRISNIYIDKNYRRKGLGHQLMTSMLDHAHSIEKCRGVILETQTCNYPAIQFYQKHGFQLCRIDISEYSNHDIERKEVRIDLIYRFEK